jgi:hypothetical protein
LTRASIFFFGKSMDCRVKPGNDEETASVDRTALATTLNRFLTRLNKPVSAGRMRFGAD